VESEVLGLGKKSETQSECEYAEEEEDRERVWEFVMLSALDERGPHIKFYPFFLHLILTQ